MKVSTEPKKIKPKPKKPGRITTGVQGFDPLIQGGFKKNSINLVAGSAGSGKTILSIQFLIDGILHGEPGIYLTFEEKKKQNI